MKLFACQACQNILYFENRVCGRCGHRLAFDPEAMMLSAIEPDGQGWITLAERSQPRFLCSNTRYDSCNWLTDAATNDAFCRACRHNGTVPDLAEPARLGERNRFRCDNNDIHRGSFSRAAFPGAAWLPNA